LDYDTLSEARFASIPSSTTYLRVAGYHAIGDGGGGLYVKTAAAPNHKSYFVNDNDRVGTFWVLTEKHVNLLQFGALDQGSAGTFDNSEPLDRALLYCQATGARSLEIPGLFRVFNPVRDIDFEIEIWGQGPNRSGFFRDYSENTRRVDVPSHPGPSH